MPGYRGHLGGGLVAYGITIGLIVFLSPHLFNQSHSTFISFVPWMIISFQHAIAKAPSVMLWKKHVFFSSSEWRSLIMLLEWLLCALIGSLLPDFDTKSKGQKWVAWFLCILFICLAGNQRYDLVSYGAIIGIVPLLVNHRSLFHRIWFLVLFCGGICCGLQYLFPSHSTSLAIDTLFLLMGALSHIYLDLGVRGIFRV